MIFSIFLHILLIDTIKPENEISGKKEFMIEIKDEWLESVKLQSKIFGLKHKRKIVSNIHLFEADHMFNGSDSIQKFMKTFKGKVVDVEKREYSKLRFVHWLYDSPAPPGFKQWVLTTRQKPKFEKTWPYYGMDIQEAWSIGMTGLGVKVAVVDSGVELNHQDLKRNIDRKMSKSFDIDDIDNGDAKRLYFYPETDEYTSHGTKAAGLIAAEFGNGICQAGVAFNATIISLKFFKIDERYITPAGFLFPDDHISQALEYRRHEIDIYSCSFGLANKFAVSTNHIRTVLKEGAKQGRNGKGSIYVFSAGNRGYVYDCNTVSYTSSIYTITIASVGKGGTKPRFAMPCAIVLAATYGEYRTFDGNKKLNTTTLDGECENFRGTSASAALASGIIALMLQANKNLTWRDVQHIIVMSSSVERLTNRIKTTINGRGLKYNPYFGFGLMNATEAVLLAQNWTTVPTQMNYTAAIKTSSQNIGLRSVVEFPNCKCRSECIRYIEHVRVRIVYSIDVNVENHLEISLKSPSGTRSILLHAVKRKPEKSGIVERSWNFTSVQFWREDPYGNWTLRMTVREFRTLLPFADHFQFVSASFTFFGTTRDPYTKMSSTETDNVSEEDCATIVVSKGAEESNAGGVNGSYNVLSGVFFDCIFVAVYVFVLVSILAACYMYKKIQVHENSRIAAVDN